MENMPFIIQILILALLLYGCPLAVGCCLPLDVETQRPGQGQSPVFAWIAGQMILWAAFQLVCVPFVLLEQEFDAVTKAFGVLSGVLVLAGLTRLVLQKRTGGLKLVTKPERGTSQTWLPWLLFAGLLMFQLIQSVRLAYGDGDDAYYVAVSSITENAETMYRKLPYTGGTSQVDIRHGLAPFPVWIAFLARVSGIKAVSVAHVAMPLMLIPMTYGIYYLLGKRLFRKRRGLLPWFLIFTEVLVLFGGYSFYTVEHFMLARSRQGKAALGAVVLPMLVYLMLVLLDKLQEESRLSWGLWILLCGVMLVGCLCSTMGAFLMCMMVAVTGLCAAVSYKRWKVLIPLALCCVPCVCYALIYVLN